MSHAALEPESADEHPWELKRRTLPAKGHLTCNLPLSDSKYYFEGITKNIRKPALLQTSICNYGEHALGDNLLIDELVDGSREPHPPLYPVGWVLKFAAIRIIQILQNTIRRLIYIKFEDSNESHGNSRFSTQYLLLIIIIIIATRNNFVKLFTNS